MTAVDANEGMTGSLVVKGVKSHQYKSFKVDGSDWPPKYWKVVLELEDSVSLAFSDARRFARVRLQVGLKLFPVPAQLDKLTSALGSPNHYLASHEIDVERCTPPPGSTSVLSGLQTLGA